MTAKKSNPPPNDANDASLVKEGVRWTKIGVLIALLLGASGTYFGIAQLSVARHSESHGPTRVVVFAAGNFDSPSPVRIITTKQGDCFSTSIASARPDAFRCIAGNEILDPCFSDGTDVLCPTPPKFEATRLTKPDFSPLIKPGVQDTQSSDSEPSVLSGDPWFLELANGYTCNFLTGTTAIVAGVSVDYGCGGISKGSSGDILGHIDRSSQTWTVLFRTTAQPQFDKINVSSAWF